MAERRPSVVLSFLSLAAGVTALAYAGGAFVLGLALHAPEQHGWRPAEFVAVGLYPLVWLGSGWGLVELWNRAHRRPAHPRT